MVATTDGARVVSNDNSCVTPSDLFTEARTDPNGLALNAFKNYQYTGTNLDALVDAGGFISDVLGRPPVSRVGKALLIKRGKVFA